MQTLRRSRRTVAAVLLGLSLPGCHHWVQPQGATPQDYVAAEQPPKVRVTCSDSTRLILVAPSVVGDTILGEVPDDARPVRLAIADVGKIEIRRFDVGATLGVVFAVVVVLSPLAYLIAVGAATGSMGL